jgi:hypothetical protein
MVPLASILINVIIPVFSVIAWMWILTGAVDSGDLAHKGVGSLKYFTVLSNLFSGVVSLIHLIVCLAGSVMPGWLVTLKLVAAAAVMLTFLVTAVLLVPQYGWKSLYRGGNFWLHLVLPLLAAVDCCLFVPVSEVPLRMTLWAMVPTAIYAVFYLGRVFMHGARPGDSEYDFYNFLRWGVSMVPAVVAAMLLVTWGLALVVRLLGWLVQG